MARSSKPDLIATIEACYRVEQPNDAWLRGVIESLSWLDQGLGIFGFTYLLRPSFELDPSPIVQVGCPEHMRRALDKAFENGVQFNRAAYLDTDAGSANDIPGYVGTTTELASRGLGVFDSWGVNGRNWDRCNAAIIINRTEAVRPSPELLIQLQRLAIHLASGARLQRRLSGNQQREAAVLSPSGKVEHAEGDARRADMLTALEQAARDIESARGKLRHSEPIEALDAWKGRVAARWTLVDRFERDGKRYIVASENEPSVASSHDLSSRERQVIASAALGRTNKEIAYDLGLADSTVRVLLARAAKKLGVRNRDEAVHQFRSG
jgi:DNA-binding CsgD family transcriptional regulator